jgi:hypothetical protein
MPPDAASPPPVAAPPVARLPRGRRYAVRALLTLGTLLAIVAIFAVWANRQALNADNWANTSTALLENQDVRTQVSTLLIDQVYANVDVNAELAGALPPRLKPLAGPAAGGLRNLAQQVADKALGLARVQEAWRTANRVAAQQFIDIAEGKSKLVTASGNTVALNLGALVGDLAARLGLPSSLTSKIPPDAGNVTIVSSNQISTVKDGVNALRGLALVLPFLAVALLALAVALARERRRQTLLVVGVDLILAGVVVLIARNLLGDQIVASLAKTDAVKPAAAATWSIGTHMLRDIAQATIVAGIPVIAAAWLAGPARPAHALRGAAAPWLRERPGVAYGVVAAVVLLVIAWGPIPATQMVVPVLIMIALVVLGVEVLRRQTAREFPQASVAGTRSSLRASAEHARIAVAGLGRRVTARRRDDGGTGAAGATGATAATAGRLELLERLAALHDKGALSDEEFAVEKATLHGSGSAT